MHPDVFDSMYNDYRSLREGPLARDPSGLSALELIYPKGLLLASASYLEVSTIDVIAGLYEHASLPELRIFVEKRSLERRFHSLFDWKNRKATQLFSLFGDECKARFVSRKQSDAGFGLSVDAFMEIGSLRNQLVHNNFAQFRLDKTAEEIKELHDTARVFPHQIAVLVRGQGIDTDESA
jgi:hypothetical protein